VNEELLAGGNMDPVIRAGDTVRRIAGPWTPAVHALLEALDRGGVAEAPHPLGFDAAGREVLTYLPGTVLDDAPASTRWSDDVLVECARLLRRVHDASGALVLEEREWRTRAHHPVEVICHNDFAPYNILVRDGRVNGIIDFDMASPGPRIWDVAYLAYRLVPFAEDALESPHISADGRLDRVRRLVDAYGVDFGVDEVLRVAAERLIELADFTEARADETGRTDLLEHAAMYRRDAARLPSLVTVPDGRADATAAG
jgi:hypothetical protein